MDIAEVAVRCFSDQGWCNCDSSLDALYAFAQIDCNAESSYVKCADEAKAAGCGLRVCITGEDGSRCRGFCGYEETRKRMVEAGVDESRIEKVPFDSAASIIHTLNEAENFVRYAKMKGWTRVGVVAPPFHLLRAFVTTISVAIREYPPLSVFAVPGTHLSWRESAVHSQGSVSGTRSEILKGEMERIKRYSEKGDIEEASAILQYLDRRQ